MSAAIRRPLTCTVAIALFSAQHELARRVLAERWGHPKALAVFRVLSIGWGLLLAISATQQVVMVTQVSPGTVMSTEPAIQTTMTAIGIFLSVCYVRRHQQRHPDLGLLPVERTG